jgi:hypothetical protein
LPRFARLRSQQAFEQGQKHTSTCSTRLDLARARPAPDPTRPAPRQAKPVPLPTPAPIKPAEASTVRPRSLSTSLERKITGVCPAHSVPAAAREPTTVDRPTEPFPAPSDPRERLCVPRRSHQIKVTGLNPTARERRPSSMVSLSSIPCTGRLLSTP